MSWMEPGWCSYQLVSRGFQTQCCSEYHLPLENESGRQGSKHVSFPQLHDDSKYRLRTHHYLHEPIKRYLRDTELSSTTVSLGGEKCSDIMSIKSRFVQFNLSLRCLSLSVFFITSFVCFFFLGVLHIFLFPQSNFPPKTTSLEKTLLSLVSQFLSVSLVPVPRIALKPTPHSST